MASMLRDALSNIGEAVLKTMEKFFEPLNIDFKTRLKRLEIRALIINEVKYDYLKQFGIDVPMFLSVGESFKAKIVSVEGSGRTEAFEVMKAQMEKEKEALSVSDKLVGK